MDNHNPAKLKVLLRKKQLTRGDKLRRVILFTLIPVFLFVILYYTGVIPFIWVRIYPGDRITGELTVTVNGEGYTPTSITATRRSEEIDLTRELIEKKNGLEIDTFSFRGGERATYVIAVTIGSDALKSMTASEFSTRNSENLVIYFEFTPGKWYYINSLEISADLTADDNGLYVELGAKYWSENGERVKVEDTVRNSHFIANHSSGTVSIKFGS